MNTLNSVSAVVSDVIRVLELLGCAEVTDHRDLQKQCRDCNDETEEKTIRKSHSLHDIVAEAAGLQLVTMVSSAGQRGLQW